MRCLVIVVAFGLVLKRLKLIYSEYRVWGPKSLVAALHYTVSYPSAVEQEVQRSTTTWCRRHEFAAISNIFVQILAEHYKSLAMPKIKLSNFGN